MSQQPMQETLVVSRQSTRKRARVNYYVAGSEDEQSDVETSQEVEHRPQPKKRKVERPLPKRKIFPFLELPAEIRNMIYLETLHDPKGVFLVAGTANFRRTIYRADDEFLDQVWRYNTYSGSQEAQLATPSQPFVPSILAVNKQIYTEARDVLYGNQFHVSDPHSLHTFMTNIGPRASSLVKSISVRSWGGWRGMHKAYNHACFAVMTSAINIDKFTIGGRMNCKHHPKWVARQVYRDAFPFLEAFGVAKGRFDAAADVFEVKECNFEEYGRFTGTKTHEEDMEEFRQELSRLLGAQQARIRKAPAKKSKKGKA